MSPAGRTLRFRLFLLAASGLLPLAIVAGVVLAYLMGERERDAQQSALAVSRALAAAVDAELRATMSVLQSLALSNELKPDRSAEFHALARRVAANQKWRSIVLADAQGTVLLSSSFPLNVARTSPVDAASMQQAIRSRAPVVGRVAIGPRQQGEAFAVRVPILQQGEVSHVLSAVLPAEHILAVIQRQVVPATSVVAVFDHTLTRVARSRPNPSNRPSPSLQALLASGAAEGSGTTWTLEGIRSHTGYSRLPGSGWVVATGISSSEASAGIYSVLSAVGAGLLASLALSAFLAWYLSRDVTEPIDALKIAAGALGRGQPVHLPRLEIAELQAVGTALQTASTERDEAARNRRTAEAEREMLLARATEALRLAEDAGRIKDEFLAMLGHELRNPLAPMATALHLMARKGDETTRREREVLERQVSHMKRLVDDLLDVSRITSKRLAMQFEPLHVAEVVRHAAQSVQPVLGLRRFAIDITPEGEELWVSGDEVRLGQVLNNLLGNAIKFTAPEGELALSLRRSGNLAEVTVADNGCGMPPEVLAHVFDLFYQAPQEADRSRGGLGLGLAIVRSLVEMHGGTVRATSAGEGQGSTVSVSLPLVSQPPPAVPPPVVIHNAPGRARVLVVDDNQDAADTAAALLDLAGFDVKVAYDPGVALAELDHFVPEIALLDVGLPGMSGYELAGRVRAHPNGQSCFLVALTGYGTLADVARAQEAGFDQHLVKPAAPEALLQAMEDGLKKA